MKKIGKEGGVIIYLRQEGRGIGLGNKIKAYHLQEKGYDTVDANIKLGFAPDERDYKIAGKILNDFGIKNIELLTNNPEKIEGLIKLGFNIMKRVAVEIVSNNNNVSYLRVKKNKMGHLLRKV
jgi:3,4-dihydroxy 2-butanone 4-phosphate synthase/GTP cyclohydrolase II